MTGSVGQPDLLEQVACASTRVPRRGSREQCGQFDVLERRQLIDEVRRLEDEAQRVTAQLGEARLGICSSC